MILSEVTERLYPYNDGIIRPEKGVLYDMTGPLLPLHGRLLRGHSRDECPRIGA